MREHIINPCRAYTTKGESKNSCTRSALLIKLRFPSVQTKGITGTIRASMLRCTENNGASCVWTYCVQGCLSVFTNTRTHACRREEKTKGEGER